MLLQIMAVYDDKTRAYAAPFFVSTEAVGIRAFAGAVNSAGTTIHDHPQDFSLFKLGTFDDGTGDFELEQPARFVARAVQFKRIDHVRQGPQEQVSDEAHVLGSAKGGNSEKHL